MSENEGQPTNEAKEETPEPTCTCELVATEKGTWKLRADSSPECVRTVETLANSLGPNSREYLAGHIAANGEGMHRAVTKLKDRRQTAE